MPTALLDGLRPGAGPATVDYRLAGWTVARPALVLVALALALAGLVPRRVWRVGRLAVTAVHEGGHATAALISGRRVVAVHLRADTSGATFHVGSAGRVSRTVTSVAGYPAPGLVALAGAWLCGRHLSRAWLALLAALAVVSLVLWLRNLFGVGLVLVGLVGLGWLVTKGSSGVDALIGATVTWYLAGGGLRSAIEANAQPGSGDSADLGRLVHLPAGVVKGGFVVISAACLVGSAILLFGLR